MSSNRRRFLQMTGAAALGLVDLSVLPPFVAKGAEDAGQSWQGIRFGPDIDPIVRIIEETPRDKCVAALVEQLRAGLPYRRFLAAIFFTAIRARGGHQVYLVHSAHQVSLDLPPAERLLPLFWAVDHYKWAHEDGRPVAMEPLAGPFPSAEKARSEFHEAMRRFDLDRSERALIALARSEGPRQAMEHLWQYGCRDISFIGHRAISVSNCCRALHTLEWQHAEPVLRYVLFSLYDGKGGQDVYYQPNLTRVEQIEAKLPPGWAGGKADRGATRELFAILRQGQCEEACRLAARQLTDGVGAQAIWDAVHVAAAELMILYPSGFRFSSRPLHANTTANALHHAFAASSSNRTRLLVLLQAVAWIPNFLAALGEKVLKEKELAPLEGARLPAKTADAVAEIFAALPPRAFRYDHKTKTGPGEEWINREGRADPGRKVFALVGQQPEGALAYMQAARGWLCRKATVDAHEYKLLAALFEDHDLVSPEWRPRILAASAHYLHGKQSPDAPVIVQAREALQKLG